MLTGFQYLVLIIIRIGLSFFTSGEDITRTPALPTTALEVREYRVLHGSGSLSVLTPAPIISALTVIVIPGGIVPATMAALHPTTVHPWSVNNLLSCCAKFP